MNFGELLLVVNIDDPKKIWVRCDNQSILNYAIKVITEKCGNSLDPKGWKYCHFKKMSFFGQLLNLNDGIDYSTKKCKIKKKHKITKKDIQKALVSDKIKIYNPKIKCNNRLMFKI
jgi:hypothetical protein